MNTKVLIAAVAIGAAGFVGGACAREMDADEDDAVDADELAAAIGDGRLY